MFIHIQSPSQEIDLATQVQIQDETVYISHIANILKIGMNLTLLPPAMGKSREDWPLYP